MQHKPCQDGVTLKNVIYTGSAEAWCTLVLDLLVRSETSGPGSLR